MFPLSHLFHLSCTLPGSPRQRGRSRSGATSAIGTAGSGVRCSSFSAPGRAAVVAGPQARAGALQPGRVETAGCPGIASTREAPAGRRSGDHVAPASVETTAPAWPETSRVRRAESGLETQVAPPVPPSGFHVLPPSVLATGPACASAAIRWSGFAAPTRIRPKNARPLCDERGSQVLPPSVEAATPKPGPAA